MPSVKASHSAVAQFVMLIAIAALVLASLVWWVLRSS